MTLVSVIIPNYNHATFLRLRIDSVLNQTFQDFEVIILDDCSTDASREIIEDYRSHSRVVAVFYNEKNSGSTFLQWMKGMELASGRWIWIAESDDIADRYILQRVMEVTEANENTGLVFVQSHMINHEGQILGSMISHTSIFKSPIWDSNFRMSGLEFIRRFMLIQNSIPNASAVFFKRSYYYENCYPK